MESLQLQLDISRSLLDSLDRMVSVYNTLSTSYQTQAEVISNSIDEIRRVAQSSRDTMSNSSNLSREVQTSIKSNDALQRRHVSQSQQIQSDLQSGLAENNRNYRTISTTTNESLSQIQQGVKTNASMDKQIKEAQKNTKKVKSAAKKNEDLIEALEDSTETVENYRTIVDLLGEIKDAVQTGGWSLLKTIPKLIFGFFKMAASMFTTAISSMAKFALFSMTLPFTIAKALAATGNKLRQDLAMLKEAGEEAKESFDLTSRIGKGAEKLTKFAQGSLKAFQTPESRLSELYGMGAQAGAALQKEAFTAVSSMGHFSEVYGGMLLGNSKYAMQLVQLQKGLGVSAQDMAYYALQAYNSGTNPVNELHKIKDTLERVAGETGLDFKQLAAGFHKLRTNIVEFGHLTNNEVGNLIGKLRGMKVKVEDAVSVFKKFTSFEEAAKSSAMLFQTFEMNVDAFDLLNSRDPGEMLTQFREAMFQTGRSFKDLNRHEKALMSSITGISEQGLKSLMNYMDLGLTKEEAQRLVEDQDPTKEQTKMIKGLSSVVKQLQKTLQFNGPFDAFFQGLAANAANQKELRHSFISLSEVYESIRHLGFSLKLEKVNDILRPVTETLVSVKSLVCNNKFANLLEGATRAASSFFKDTAYRMESNENSKLLMFIRPKIEKMIKLKKRKNARIENGVIAHHEKALLKSAQGLISIIVKQKGPLLKELKNLQVGAEKRDENNNVIGFKLANHVTNKGLTKIFEILSKKYSKDKVTSGQIKYFLSGYHSVLDAHFSTGLASETIKKIKDSPDIRTDIGKRIDNVYSHLLDMFKVGAPQFKNFVDIGRNIMGSLVRGMLHGIAGTLRILSGGASLAYETLGIKMSEATKKDMIAKGKNPKTYTIADWMGMDEKSAKQIKLGLEVEGVRFIKNLKPMGQFAASLLGDLLSIFSDLAGGIVNGIAFLTMKKYTMLGDTAQYAMRMAGFKPELAFAKASKIKGKDMKALGLSLRQNIKGLDDFWQGSAKTEAALGEIIAYFDKTKSTFHKESYAAKFLRDVEVTSLVSYIKNRSNFLANVSGEGPGSDLIEDADPFSRGQSLLEIMHNALRIESEFPSALHKEFKKKELEDYYSSLKGMANPEEFIKKIKTGAASDVISGGEGAVKYSDQNKFVQKYGDSETKLSAMIDRLNKFTNEVSSFELPNRINSLRKLIRKKEENKKGDLKPTKPAKPVEAIPVEDIINEGLNSILLVENKKYVLNKKDQIFIGAKKGGFIDQLVNLIDQKTEQKVNKTNSFLDTRYNKKDINLNNSIELEEISNNIFDLFNPKEHIDLSLFNAELEINKILENDQNFTYKDKNLQDQDSNIPDFKSNDLVNNSSSKAVMDGLMNKNSDVSFIEEEASSEDFNFLFDKLKEVITGYNNRKVEISKTNVVFDN